jgi:hypothetical protein
MNKWISVKDELPEEDGMYLCAFDDGTIETFEFDCLDDNEYWGVELISVTHWMPLQDLPSDES